MFAAIPSPIPLPDRQDPPVEVMRARAWAFLEAVGRRHSVRDFGARPVPSDSIEIRIQAAGTAPNGANHQSWHFAVIGWPVLKRRVRQEAEAEERAFYVGPAGTEWLAALAPLGTNPDNGFLETAPWLIAIFGALRSRSARGVLRKNPYGPESVSIATEFLILALHDAGLATLTNTPGPIGFRNENCGRPAEERPFSLPVLGHHAPGAMIPKRPLTKKLLAEIASLL